MLKIGMVDLDTSHPAAWIKVIREKLGGADVVTVWDGGTVYDKGYAQKFAAENKVAKACESLEEMVPLIDVAFIHSCNWDLHMQRAKVFVDAGKNVFLDKPIVGNMRALAELREMVNSHKSVKIVGGSSLRFAREIEEFKKKNEEIISLYINAPAPNDFFNYGIHGVEVIGGLLGEGADAVKFIGGQTTNLFNVEYKDGRQVVIQLMSPWPFTVVVTTSKSVYSFGIDTNFVYQALLEKLIPYFSGESEYPIKLSAMEESVKISLACKKAKETGDKVMLGELRQEDEGFDGKAFADRYRKARFGG